MNVSPPGSRGSKLKPLNPGPKGILFWESTKLKICVCVLSGNRVAAIALALFANKMMDGRCGQVFLHPTRAEVAVVEVSPRPLVGMA